MPGTVENSAYRAWGKYQITEIFYYSRARNYLYTPPEKSRESEFPPTGGVKQGQVFQNVNLFSDFTIKLMKPRQREKTDKVFRGNHKECPTLKPLLLPK